MLLSEQVLSSYNLGILSALRIVFVILAFQAAQNFFFFRFNKINFFSKKIGFIPALSYGLISFFFMFFFNKELAIYLLDINDSQLFDILKSGSLVPLLITICYYQQSLIYMNANRLNAFQHSLLGLLISLMALTLILTLPISQLFDLSLSRIIHLMYIKWAIINIFFLIIILVQEPHKSE